jgi:hypothetical protein
MRMRTPARAGVGADRRQHLVTVALGHHDVEYHQIGTPRPDGGETLLAIPGHRHREALAFHEKLQGNDNIGLVIDDQDLLAHTGFRTSSGSLGS